MSNVSEELFYLYARVAERAFEGVAVNLVVERKDDCSPVLVLHLNVASLSMNFNEAKPPQRRQHLPP